jgi:hypothetical protein
MRPSSVDPFRSSFLAVQRPRQKQSHSAGSKQLRGEGGEVFSARGAGGNCGRSLKDVVVQGGIGIDGHVGEGVGSSTSAGGADGFEVRLCPSAALNGALHGVL